MTIKVLPAEIQKKWMGSVIVAPENIGKGAYRLIDVYETDPNSSLGQRITVMVLDDEGNTLPGVKVAFSV